MDRVKRQQNNKRKKKDKRARQKEISDPKWTRSIKQKRNQILFLKQKRETTKGFAKESITNTVMGLKGSYSERSRDSNESTIRDFTR